MDYIKIANVSELVEKLTGVKISRQTVYNWILKGRLTKHAKERIYLRYESRAGQLYTTEKWIKDFLRWVGE